MQFSSISEDKRVAFTKQLRDLRDSEASQVVFSPALTSDERKFVHKISQDFGLKSKSQGVGEKRFITVLKKSSNVQKSSGLAPVLWSPHNNTLQALHDACFSAVCQSNIGVPANKGRAKTVDHHAGVASQPYDGAPQRDAYASAQAQRLSNSKYDSIQKKRSLLPAAHYRMAVCNLLKEHQIVLISGETGCGKSTQVPQFLLDDPDIGPGCRMAITQPRRISAVAVAERIASERSESIGTTIGYNIRLDSAKSASTQVLFLTPGVLLRKLLTDPLLLEYTHVIVDEAHERDRFTEFLQIILRDICARRSDLKLILMSATMHTDKIRSYFGDIPQINVGGSVFPVQEYYLEHALQFTHFVDQIEERNILMGGGHHAAVEGAAGHSAQEAIIEGAHSPHRGGAPPPSPLARLAKLSFLAPQYHCALCHGGPFESPEELGTHSATCYPGAKAAAPVQPRREEGLSSLDALAAGMAAIRLAKTGKTAAPTPTPTLASPHVPVPATVFSFEEDTVERDSPAPGSESEPWIEDGALDPLDVPIQDMVGTRSRAGSEDDNALHTALLTQYQNHWDDSQVDCDLIFSLLKYVFSSAFGQQGSVLVFLPGWDDISRLHRILSSSVEFQNSSKFMLLQLHSGIQKKEQEMVFHALRPGQHKIILSTNIAETSITIDDVTVVINAGRVKEKTYDPHTKLAYLQSAWISQASARQRRGRAGRTQAGVCFHLYSALRSQHLSEFQDSELLRMPLEELVLQAKTLGVAPGEGEATDSVTSFLLKAMDPPHILSIKNAISLLQAINCMDEHEQVTPIGSVVSQLPLNPRMGRMILLGCLLGCGPSVLATAAAMGYRDPFIMPATDQQRLLCNRAKARLGGDVSSDQLVVLRALGGFNTALKRSGQAQARRFCDDNFLSYTTMQYMEDLVGQLQGIMRDVNLQVNAARAQRNDGNFALLQAVVSTGLYPDVGMRRQGTKIFSTERACKAKIHPSSVNSRLPVYRKECAKPVELIGFQDLIAGQAQAGAHIGGANLLMLSTTPVSVFSMLLTCGRLEEVSTGEENEDLKTEAHVEVEVDGWLSLQLHRDHLLLVRQARQVLSVALGYYLHNPHKLLDKALTKGIDRIVEVLSFEQHASLTIH